MMILSSCLEPAMLSAMRIINMLIFIAKIVIPIVLIIVIICNVVKSISSEVEVNFKIIFKNSMIKFFMAVAIFFIPTLISAFLDMANFDNKYMSCLTFRLITYDEIDNAYAAKAEILLIAAEKSESIDDYKAAKAAVNRIKNTNKKSSFESRLTKLYEIIESKRKASEEDDINKPIIQGKYVSPITGVTGFGSINDTYCTYSNSMKNILHDVAASVGTRVYAPFDGTAKFYQVYCSTPKGNLLWSYGNKIIIEGNNGEGIVMAHFSSFVINDQKTTGNITGTCHDAYSSCGSSVCTLGAVNNLVGTSSVKAGDLIGYSGNTGNSDGPHLHVELKDPVNGGCVVDPWHTYFGY